MASVVISKIISLQSSFTVSENEISQFVINNPDFVITNTITNLAKKIGTSEASINRFCKKVGYKGFNNFKIALAQNSYYSNMEKENSSNADSSIIESMSLDYTQLIKNTSAMLSEESLNNSVELIKNAETIHVISLINTSFIANELAFKLSLIGLKVKTHIDKLDIHLCTSNLSSKDLLIVIVPTLLCNDIYPSLITARDREAKIISITSTDSPKFNDIVDVKLITPDKIIANNSLALSNSLMLLFTIDLIYGLLLRDDKTLRQRKLNSDTIINTHQSIDRYLIDF
ncbi:MAG: MurR/RpiR family transcriptional regulator [Clostridium paraputrificum]|uniref:MurR/RpiR family transcriptional regulator n=1 Tax=Clostridium sp. TaxID=1506 RepID=UPI001DD982D3|nr:MurR/RpiR family transcriptional regulator [Clostridium sp.]MBS5985235.1 MurR/RpiR family transcriptional regulator [Clostridium sp.]